MALEGDGDEEVVGTHLPHRRTDMVTHSRILGGTSWTYLPCRGAFFEPWVEPILEQEDEGVRQDWARQL